MAKRKAPKRTQKPAKQAISPISGTAPPVEHQFKPGQSGNPKGRQPAGMSIREWWNVMQDWPAADVTAVMADEKATVAKKAAARAFLDACSNDRSTSGQPIAGADLERIIDHTAGKATQSVEVKGDVKVTNDAAAVLKRLEGNPEAFDAALEMVERLEAGSHDGRLKSGNS